MLRLTEKIILGMKWKSKTAGMKFEANMPLTVFKKGNLTAFRGSDGYCFNVIELTGDVTRLSKVKKNILTPYSEDDVVAFQREEQWKGGSIQFVHILRTGKCEIMQVNAARFFFAIEKGAFLVSDKVGFDDICETALSSER